MEGGSPKRADDLRLLSECGDIKKQSHESERSAALLGVSILIPREACYFFFSAFGLDSNFFFSTLSTAACEFSTGGS